MKHPGRHDPDQPHIDPDTGEVCFGCKVKAGFALGASATPTRNLDGQQRRKMRPMVEPSWEAGVAGEHRPGGGFMPYLDGNGSEVGIKQYGERRREFDAVRREQITSPTKL